MKQKIVISLWRKQHCVSRKSVPTSLPGLLSCTPARQPFCCAGEVTRMHSSPECPYGPQLSLPGLHSCCVPWDSMMRIFMATPVFMCRLRLLRGLCMPAWPRSSLVLLPAFAPQRKGCGGKKKMASWEEHGAQCCCAGYQPCTAKKRRNRMKPTKIQCSWSVHLMEGSCGTP